MDDKEVIAIRFDRPKKQYNEIEITGIGDIPSGDFEWSLAPQLECDFKITANRGYRVGSGC